MENRKVLTGITIVLAAILALAACGGKTPSDGHSQSTAGTASTDGAESSTLSGGQNKPEDFGYIRNETKDGLIITYYNGRGSDVTIPDTIENLPVVGFRASVFSEESGLVSVSIPDTVTVLF